MEKTQYDGNTVTSWDKCDWRPRETDQPQKGTLKLSQAIRIGSKMSLPNDGNTFLCGGACAVGAAYLALYGNRRDEHPFIHDAVMAHFGISDDLWNRFAISSRYSAGESREQIADWLEAQGY